LALFFFTLASEASRLIFLVNSEMSELAIIQKTYDLIKWYVPILNRLPRQHRFILGNIIIDKPMHIVGRY